MSELVADCPRCGANHVTFDIKSDNYISTYNNWQKTFESFGVCRHCGRATIFILCDESRVTAPATIANHGFASFAGSIHGMADIEGYVNQKDNNQIQPPEYLPEEIGPIFKEGAACLSIGCFNAAAAMFRLCIDLATKSKLPLQNEGSEPNAKIRRNLGLRLSWLFDNGRLPEALRELSTCIKEDGNDGVHEGTIQREDAEDIMDFTFALLERLYTEPERLRVAKARRDKRRGVSQ